MKKILMFLIALIPILTYSQSDTSTNIYDTTSCNEVVIIGVRADENKPVTEKTFNSAEILKNYQGQDIPFFLNKKNPSILVYSDGGNYNGYQYFRLRGIDQTRINMTLNGVPMNEPEDQGAYFSNFPDFSKNVSSMQVQRGIGISSNGTASYGGSINFESTDLKANTGLDFNIGHGSFNTSRLSIGYQEKVNDKLYFYGRYSKVYSDGYRNNSSTDGQTFFYSGAYYGKKSIIKATGFFGESQNGMAYLASPVDSIKVNRKYNPLSPNEKDHFNQNHIQVNYVKEINDNLKISNTIYYTNLKGSYDVYVNPDMLFFKLKSDFYGIVSNMSYIKRNLDMNIGVNLNNYSRTHMMSIKPDITNNIYSNTGYKNEESIFLKLSYRIVRFTPYVDLQLRNVNFKYSPDQSYNLSFSPINWLFLNPKAGLNYKPNNYLTLYTFIGKTSREPTRNDMFSGADDIDNNNYAELSNFNRIKPESVINFELGVKHHYKKLHTQFNFFDMEFKNEIASIGQLSYIGLPLRKNVKSSYRRGVELDIKFDVLKRLKVWGNFTYMVAKIKEYTSDYDNMTYHNVNPLLTPKVITNIGIDYSFCKYLEMNFDMKYITSSYLDNTNNSDLKLPAYTVLNLNTTMHLKHQLDIVFNVNNILNTKYYNSGYAQDNSTYYFVAPTRNFFLTLNKKF